MIRTFLAALLAAACLVPGIASASTVAYDTITGKTVDTGAVPSIASGLTSAYYFTAGASGVVSSIDVTLGSLDATTTTMQFGFFADGFDAPGSALGDRVSTSVSSLLTERNLTGFGNVDLVAGQTYWLVAEWLSGSGAGLLYANTTATMTSANRVIYNGIRWFSYPQEMRLRVNVDAAAVPLPAGGMLLLTSLGVFAVARRRRG